MKTLGIESTCDETSISVVENGDNILSNVVFSQVKTHESFGGVVPELASRRHIEAITFVLDKALKEANVTLDEIDQIAVAVGPGLLGALVIGVNFANALSFATNKPIIGINHIEAHLYGAILENPKDVHYPALGVILSGGHTQFVLMKQPHTFELIGTTLDDAMGEAFDKVAKMLDLNYPGGPEIEKLAKEGDSFKYPFKGGVVKNKPFDLSFSGLKTSVLYTLFGQDAKRKKQLSLKETQDAAASFQHVAIKMIIDKLLKICEKHSICSFIFGGGVTCNEALKEKVFERFQNQLIFWPKKELSLDNGAMIAALGFAKKTSLELEAQTRIAL